VEWALNYADFSNPIDVPKSCHEGRLIGKGTIGKKGITPDPHLFHCIHFHMLEQMSIVSKYLDEHKEMLLKDNPRRNESRLANEHMKEFIGWLWDRISHTSDTQTSEYLKLLAHGHILTVVTYKGYDINGYTFYTEQQDKKITYQNNCVRVDAYDATGQENKYVLWSNTGDLGARLLWFQDSSFPLQLG
jgi:hypothetical protein